MLLFWFFCDIATIWFFLDLATGDKATKSEIKCSNVQMFKMIFKRTIRHEGAIRYTI